MVDGRQVSVDAPAVSPLDPGLLGHGVYESIRTYGQVPFAVERHVERLTSGAEALDVPCDGAAVAADVRAAAAALAPRLDAGAEARIRVVVTAGGVRTVVADPLPDRSRDREQGLAAVTLPWPRDPAGPTAGVKATSTAAARVGSAYARKRGAATGLWLTPGGCVSEALAANVFAVLDGALVTPPLDDGALAGVTRALLLEWAADAGLAVREESLPAARLAAADEAFVSATSEPVVPLMALDGVAIAGAAVGPVTRRLQALFDARARALVAV